MTDAAMTTASAKPLLDPRPQRHEGIELMTYATMTEVKLTTVISPHHLQPKHPATDVSFSPIHEPNDRAALFFALCVLFMTKARLQTHDTTPSSTLRPKQTPWMFPPPRTHNDDHVFRPVIVQDIASPHLIRTGVRFHLRSPPLQMRSSPLPARVRFLSKSSHFQPSTLSWLSPNSLYLPNSTTTAISNPSSCNSVVSSPGPSIRYNPTSNQELADFFCFLYSAPI